MQLKEWPYDSSCHHLVIFAGTVIADPLEAKNYKVVITMHCKVGEVSCNNITYTGKSKRSGSNISYFVYESDLLQAVREPKEVLIDEQGSCSFE
ncbi:hypothetical protein ACMXYR_06240 [Neptuniibacter sp. QD29_5]|uniref:hypothetical protein n=1 Tax=Neptuniibacter sp. QD29_5 TaxID=3398207 RepID=UPI0039F57B30